MLYLWKIGKASIQVIHHFVTSKVPYLATACLSLQELHERPQSQAQIAHVRMPPVYHYDPAPRAKVHMPDPEAHSAGGRAVARNLSPPGRGKSVPAHQNEPSPSRSIPRQAHNYEHDRQQGSGHFERAHSYGPSQAALPERAPGRDDRTRGRSQQRRYELYGRGKYILKRASKELRCRELPEAFN